MAKININYRIKLLIALIIVICGSLIYYYNICENYESINSSNPIISMLSNYNSNLDAMSPDELQEVTDITNNIIEKLDISIPFEKVS